MATKKRKRRGINKTLPIKLWIPMRLALPPVETRFLFVNENDSVRGGVRNAGDDYITSNPINVLNIYAPRWRFFTRKEAYD